MEPQLTTSWTPATAPAEGTVRKALETDASTADLANSQPRDDFDVPSRIGKFEVRQILGRGGQAVAVLAHDPDLHREVVLKLYHAARDPEKQTQVLNEGRSLARVHSPYVAQCHGVDRYQGVPYLILEYVRGQTLSQRLKAQRLTLHEALEMAGRLADGLAAVHAVGLLHRDLKPSNVLVGDDGLPRIVDFGLATSPDSSELEKGQISGTPAYMAPEQARGDVERFDARTDVFGLGAVLYELLTGRPPYVADDARSLWEQARDGRIAPPSQFVPDLPAAVGELCERCLATDPAQRFATAVDFRNAIRTLHERQTRRGREFALRIGRFQIRLMIGTAAALLLLAVLWKPPVNELRSTAMHAPAMHAPAPAAPVEPAILNPPPAIPETESLAGPLAEMAKSSLLRDAEPRTARRELAAKAGIPATPRVSVEPVGGSTALDGTLVFAAGSPLQFQLLADQDCRVELWRVAANGQRRQLFPNDFDRSPLVRSGEPRRVPPADHADVWSAEVAAADEQLFLLVSAADADVEVANADKSPRMLRLRVTRP